MEFYKDNELLIRYLHSDGAEYFTSEERKQGWHINEAKFLFQIHDMKNGKAISFVAEYNGKPVG